jgi:hypothetical protein
MVVTNCSKQNGWFPSMESFKNFLLHNLLLSSNEIKTKNRGGFVKIAVTILKPSLNTGKTMTKFIWSKLIYHNNIYLMVCIQWPVDYINSWSYFSFCLWGSSVVKTEVDVLSLSLMPDFSLIDKKDDESCQWRIFLHMEEEFREGWITQIR